MKVTFKNWRIKLLFIPMLGLQISVYSQNAEFELACRVIKSIHSNDSGILKEIIINDKVVKGDFDFYLYLSDKMPCDSLNSIIGNEQKIQEIEKRFFKPGLPYDPKECRYFSSKKLKHLKGGVFISFVKFDGKFLRVNVIKGVNFFGNPIHLSTYYYQMVITDGQVRELKWTEVKY